MPVTCRSILSMDCFENDIRLLAGTGGLSNTIRWTHVFESIDAIRFLQGGELTFMTGAYFGGNIMQLVRAVELLSEKHAAGLAVNTGRFIVAVPDAMIKRADELDLPLFEIPWKVRLVNVTKRIGKAILQSDMKDESISCLLEKILFSDEKSCTDFVRTAEFYGYKISGPMYIAEINVYNYSQYITNSKNGSEFIGFQQKIRFLIEHSLETYLRSCLYMWKNDSLILAIPYDKQQAESRCESICENLREEARRTMNGLVIHIGLGDCCDGIECLRKSYSEARLALKLIEDNPDFACMSYKNAGIYKFLNRVDNKNAMREFFFETMGPLLRYDRKNRTEFFKTIQAYLEEGENTMRTSKRLYIHRNTLQYRLGRIEEILNLSLKDSEEKLDLQVACKLGKFLDLQDLSINPRGTADEEKPYYLCSRHIDRNKKFS